MVLFDLERVELENMIRDYVFQGLVIFLLVLVVYYLMHQEEVLDATAKGKVGTSSGEEDELVDKCEKEIMASCLVKKTSIHHTWAKIVGLDSSIKTGYNLLARILGALV